MDQKKLRVFFYSSIHLYKITNILLLEEFRRLVIPMQKKKTVEECQTWWLKYVLNIPVYYTGN